MVSNALRSVKAGQTPRCDILLAGAGKMGGALLQGWLNAGLAQDLSIGVLDPTPSDLVTTLIKSHGLALNPNIAALTDAPPALCVLAVKPQIMDGVLQALRPLAAAGTCFVSVAAGRSFAALQAGLGSPCAILRAMPNTPASVGRGITVCVANEHVTSAQGDLTETLLKAVGEVAWIEDEALIDPVTAVSGSGPAYVFHLVEAMAAAGEAEGLPPDLAMRLARATVSGAGEMLARSPSPASALREAVTSPGGTTAAALSVLQGRGGLTPLMTKAIAAAAARGRELARG